MRVINAIIEIEKKSKNVVIFIYSAVSCLYKCIKMYEKNVIYEIKKKKKHNLRDKNVVTKTMGHKQPKP